VLASWKTILHTRERSDLQSVNLHLLSDPPPRKWRRICKESVLRLCFYEKSCAWLTYPLHQYLVIIACLRAEAVLESSLEARQGQLCFLLPVRARWFLMGAVVKRRENVSVMPSPWFATSCSIRCLLRVHKRFGPDSPKGRRRHSGSQYQRCRVDASDPRRMFLRGSRI
jgi:hypothetical protein